MRPPLQYYSYTYTMHCAAGHCWDSCRISGSYYFDLFLVIYVICVCWCVSFLQRQYFWLDWVDVSSHAWLYSPKASATGVTSCLEFTKLVISPCELNIEIKSVILLYIVLICAVKRSLRVCKMPLIMDILLQNIVWRRKVLYVHCFVSVMSPSGVNIL
jgi:hypothetical protein